jgi:hypothetical protein
MIGVGRNVLLINNGRIVGCKCNWGISELRLTDSNIK